MGYLLILGANSDIAKALAEKYASNGYDIYLSDKNTEDIEETRRHITETYGVNAHVFKFDVLEFYNHRNFYNSLDPKPVGVICTEGYLGDQKRAQKDFLESKKIIDTNYTGLISIINIIAADFEERDDGFIIGLGSVAGETSGKELYTYYSAKEGFLSYLLGLQNRLKKVGVQVLAVKPGFVLAKATRDMEIPEKLTIATEELAESIFTAQQKGEHTLFLGDARNLKSVIAGSFQKIFQKKD